MDLSVLAKVAQEGGIAVVSIFSILFIVRYLADSHRVEMEAVQAERRETQKAFMNFVEANNHQKTELVRESTAAITEAKNAIMTHTEVLRALTGQK